MPLGTNHLTITTSDKFIPERWTGKVIRARESRLVSKSVITDYSDFANGDEGFGDVVHIPNVSDLTAYDKSANTQVTLSAPTETDNSITVNKHKHSAFLTEDRLKKVALGTYLNNYSSKAGYAIAKAFDTDILSEYSNANANVGDGSTKITRLNFVTSLFKLDEADAPMEDRFGVFAPDAKADLLDLDEFTLYTNTGVAPSAMMTGSYGEIFGLPILVSTNVQVEAATTNVVHNLVLQKEAIGFVMPQAPRPQLQYKLEYLGWLYVTDMIYGYATLRSDHMVDFRSKER